MDEDLIEDQEETPKRRKRTRGHTPASLTPRREARPRKHGPQMHREKGAPRACTMEREPLRVGDVVRHKRTSSVGVLMATTRHRESHLRGQSITISVYCCRPRSAGYVHLQAGGGAPAQEGPHTCLLRTKRHPTDPMGSPDTNGRPMVQGPVGLKAPRGRSPAQTQLGWVLLVLACAPIMVWICSLRVPARPDSYGQFTEYNQHRGSLTNRELGWY